MINPSFWISTRIAVSETISVITLLILPSNIESGSPTFTFSAKLYCTGTVMPPSCSKPSFASSTNSSPFLRSRWLSFSMPSRIFGPCKSCKIATERPFFSAAMRIHLICWSRSSFEPWEQLSLQPLTPAIITSSIFSAEFVDGPIVAKILVRLKSLLIYLYITILKFLW